MIYQALDSEILLLGGRETLPYHATKDVIIIPEDGTRVFVHWLGEGTDIKATYTMAWPIKTIGKMNLTNGTNSPISIKIITL